MLSPAQHPIEDDSVAEPALATGVGAPARIRAAGLRVTAGRVAALCFLEMHPHSAAADIHAALAPEHPSLSLQSVHNIVHDLTGSGILRRIDLPDSESSLYETRAHDNHHHVQCVACHRVEDVDCVVGEAPCLTPNHAHSMRIIEAAVVFRGVCASCEPAVARDPKLQDHSNLSSTERNTYV